MSDWTNVPIGAGVAVLIVREMSRFLRERQQEKDGGKGSVNGGAGAKSVEFWEKKQAEVVYTELERHVIPRLDEIERRLGAVHDNVRELRWRGQNRKGD